MNLSFDELCVPCANKLLSSQKKARRDREKFLNDSLEREKQERTHEIVSSSPAIT